MSIIGSNILAGSAGQGGGYTIERSLRLRSSASASLNRTFLTPSDGKKWTYSLWMKKSGTAGTGFNLPYLLCTEGSGAQGFIGFGGTQADDLYFGYAGAGRRISPAVFRDPSAWYHLVFSIDTTQADETNRAKLYVNGVQTTWTTSTSIGLNDTTQINQSVAHNIGRQPAQPYDSFNGYLTEVNFIDGQALTPSDFGNYNEDTGVWQPAKYIGTYGTNGFYLPFSDNTTTTTLAADTSGNGNDWTPNNISLTSGVTYDSMTDTPTPYADGGNYAVLNPLRQNGSATFAQGNLAGTSESGTSRGLCSTIVLPRSDKWYMEWTPSSSTTNWFGVTANEIIAADINTAGQQSVLYYAINGTKWVNGSNSAYGSSYTTQTIGIAFDGPAGTVTFYRDNVSQGAISLPSSTVDYVFCMGNAGGGGVTNYANFGQRPFAYTPPTGFKALHTGNLPDSAIVDGSEYFNVDTYAGTGATNARTIGFQPDFVWIKSRTNAYWHKLFDSARGANKPLVSNDTTAELTETTGLMSFDSDGFTLGSSADSTVNNSGSGQTYVAWNWKANGAGVSNTDGSITSTVSANPTSGFSIVTYTGTGAAATIGHGLGAAPSMIIVKDRVAVTSWQVYHRSLEGTDAVFLNSTGATFASSVYWNNTNPTSSVFSIGTSSFANTSSNTYVAYAFAEVPGFSKFGSYTGNGSADGPFVFTGFRPAFVMIKQTSGLSDWWIWDTSRETYNQMSAPLFPNAPATESPAAAYQFDILSNGFKMRSTNPTVNGSGLNYIFACFAENPFKNALAR